MGGSHEEELTASGPAACLARVRSPLRLAVLAAAALAIGGLAALPAPAQAAGSPFIYAANLSGSVEAIDPTSGAVAATIPVGSEPTDVVLNPAGTRAYVTNFGSDTISVIDTSSNIVTATISLGSFQPYGIAVNHDGTMAYVSTVGAIIAIDTSTNTVTATIPVPGANAGIALNQAGTVAYVADGEASLTVVDLTTGTVTATIPIGNNFSPFNMAVSPDGAKVYMVSDNAGGCIVSVIDTSTDKVTATIPVGASALNIAINPAGTLVYVTNENFGQNNGSVSVIDPSTNTVTATITGGLAPIGVAFAADGALAYVGNRGSISVINTATGTITGTIPLDGNGAIYAIAVPQTLGRTTTSLSVSPNGSAFAGDTVTLTASETPAAAGTVQFFDGASPLGSPVTVTAGTATYTTSSLALGSHSLTAVFTPSSTTLTSSTSQPVTLQIKSPPFAIDQTINQNGTGTVTTAPFSTTGPRLLVAFTSSDGSSTKQTTTVTGGGLTWTLIQRANTKGGTAEIWAAQATGPLTGATVTSKPKTAGYDQSVTVVAFTGASGIGASASAGKSGGLPSVSLNTTQAGSWVFGVGEDYSNDIARTLGTGQSLISQWIDPGPGETFWVQDENAPTPAAGTAVTINDTAPKGDTWNLAAAEILPAAS